MKVAIVKKKIGKSGTDRYLWAIAREFSKRGIEVEIVGIRVSHKEEGLQIRSLRRVPLLGRLGELLRINFGLQKHIGKRNYSCILSLDRTFFHTHIRAGGGCHRGWLERRARYLPGWRKVSLWFDPYHRLVLSIEKKGFTAPWVKRIIANSEMVKREIIEYYGVDEERIAVVHNGVQWDKLSRAFEESPAARLELRRQWGLDPDGFYFLFVGSGFERKGLGFAIEALQQLPKEANLLVVGADKNEGRYRALAERLGLGGRVRFFGQKGDVVPFYQMADAFVLPTIYDPFSNASLEALAMGLFCVTTKANGCSEVMADFAGVAVEDPGNVDELAEAMSRAMALSSDRRLIRQSVAHLTLEGHVSRVVDICLEERG